jgi:D-cysteine desulfhydrase family pyridoxal phosphate-dependent enzyme
MLGRLDNFPRIPLGHTPTPLERLPNMSARLGGGNLWVKRDDCTGLAFGGNKIRQLEFYMGEALAQNADALLITGAIQSNFVRSAAAAANQLNLECHVQLEERVPGVDERYRRSGNVLLDRLLGAHVYSYPSGEDEAGADRELRELGERLRGSGKTPYQIHLAPGHAPLGALGYVCAAREILHQAADLAVSFDEIVVASGSGHTHAGLLFGLRALGYANRVTGVCVRRDKASQRERIRTRCEEIAGLLAVESPVRETDIIVLDDFLPPGYGQLNDASLRAMELAAHTEALFLDPVYTAKTMAGFIMRAQAAQANENLLFIHTGGTPAIFAYEPTLSAHLSPKRGGDERAAQQHVS